MTTEPEVVPLSPVSFLERAADVYPEKAAVVTASGWTQTYSEFRAEAGRVAARLRMTGVGRGDTVAVLARNGPDALLMHYAVPGVKAALVAMNTRLAPPEYEYILLDSGAEVLFVEPALSDRIRPISNGLSCRIVDLPDADTHSEASGDLGVRYGDWLDAVADESGPLDRPDNELDPIAINYTSGTTGRAKGAVYSHRGAYLNALGVALGLELNPASNYLWTLPMFHCNGWCFTWGVTAVGGSHVALADFDPGVVLDLIGRHRVSHLCGAPVVLNEIASRARAFGRQFDHPVRFATGGAPPAPTTIAAMREVGIGVTHLYGLTETYGPSIICEAQPDWDGLDHQALAQAISRQGVRTINVESVRVVDESFADVPRDGQSMGEIVIRSNTVVPRYHGDPERSSEVIRDGWLFTGDLAVMHPDGYLEVRDRSKDIIISGGENVSSIEVENVLLSHPAVSEAAVVASPHPTWGEVPVAFVTLRSEQEASEADLIEYVRARLAHFKAPKAVLFMPLPKTSTGKVQKYELRKKASALAFPGMSRDS
jgi:fatty-acyl-CoA synthase